MGLSYFTCATESAGLFQVSIGALEDSRLLVWPAEQLQQYLKSKPFLTAVFTNLVGKDITTKLYQVSQVLPESFSRN